jgi:hypothetical protein
MQVFELGAHSILDIPDVEESAKRAKQDCIMNGSIPIPRSADGARQGRHGVLRLALCIILLDDFALNVASLLAI